jgi:hypothetical protein
VDIFANPDVVDFYLTNTSNTYIRLTDAVLLSPESEIGTVTLADLGLGFCEFKKAYRDYPKLQKFFEDEIITYEEITSPGGITCAFENAVEDATLLALANLDGTPGIVTQTGTDTFIKRSLQGTTARISVTNGNGASAAPSIDISNTYVGQTSITTLGTVTTGKWRGDGIEIAYGGTGQTTASSAFGALSPLTTKGDLVSHNGTSNVRVGVGSSGQSLVSDPSTSSGLKWANPNIPYDIISANTTQTTSSATYTGIPDMLLEPDAGTYLAFFSASYKNGNHNSSLYFAVHVDGVIVPESERLSTSGGTQFSDSEFVVAITAIPVTVAEGQEVTIKWKTSSGTSTIKNRALVLIKVA